MTVETDLDRAQYATNGTTGPWTVRFYFLASDEISVTYTNASGVDTLLTLDVDYTVVGAGNENGGTVTTTQAYASGGQLVILRDVSFTQETEYVDGDGFPAKAHERALDRLTMAAQQLRESGARAVQFPASFTGNTVLGAAADLADTLMGFDDAGGLAIVDKSSAPERLLQKEQQTVAAGDTLITLASITYTRGIGSLMVFARGGQLRNGVDYTETSTQSFTLLTPFTRPTQLDMVAGAPVSNTVVGDATLVAVSPAGGPPTNVQALLRGESTVSPSVRGYWLDQGAGANIHRLKDRVFVGRAADTTGNFSGTQGGFVPTSTEGANWAFRDGQFVSATDTGLIAVAGFASNANAASSPTETIAVGGWVIGNKASRSVWGLYSDVQYVQGNNAYGLEIALKNASAVNADPTPYNGVFGAYGLQITAGGDTSYGPGTPLPSAAGILFVKLGSTLNKGIVFNKDSLTGTDGTTGTATAIEMAKGHGIQWDVPTGQLGLLLRSDVTTTASDVSLLAADNTFTVRGTNGVAMLNLTHTASAANYLTIRNAATGNSATIAAGGSDANSDVWVSGHGTGGFRVFDGGGATKFQINTTGVGFFAATPIAKPTAAAAATDAATTQTLANSLRTILINYGLAA